VTRLSIDGESQGEMVASIFDQITPAKALYHINQLLEDRQLDLALDELRSLFESFPEYAPAFNLLGWIHANFFQDQPNARKCYQFALDFEPEYAPSYFNMMIACNILGDYEKVRMLGERAMAVVGVDQGKIYHEIGLSYELQGDYPAAKSNFQKATFATIVDGDFDRFSKASNRCESKLLMRK
jgi:tetratricopeptide (TPR) repeat protein